MPLAEQTVEHWQEILRINLIGPFLAIKYAMPHMIKQKYGSIVCTASVAGLKSGASGHPYASSKAGVISLVQTTAYSLSGTGVRINAVCPGLIETGMTKPIFDRAREKRHDGKIGQLNPLSRYGQPDEIATDGTVSRQRRCILRQRPRDPGRWRPDRSQMPYAGRNRFKEFSFPHFSDQPFVPAGTCMSIGFIRARFSPSRPWVSDVFKIPFQ